VDVAGALKLGIERFNFGERKDWYMLVLLTSGLQNDSSVDFSGGFYPSDSWITHQVSPFAAIPESWRGESLNVLFVSRPQDYINRFHACRIERWYTLLLRRKKVRLIGFISDYQAAACIIRSGDIVPNSRPKPEDINGPLILYRVVKTNAMAEMQVDVTVAYKRGKDRVQG